MNAASESNRRTNPPTATKSQQTNPPRTSKSERTNPPTATKSQQTNPPTTTKFVTNEPTDYHEILTNEPTDSGVGDVASLDPGGDTNQRDQMALQAEIEPDQTVESYEQGVARRKARRAESLRKLNEQARHEAADAMALRRALRRERRIQSGKRGGQRHGGAGGAGLGAVRENVVAGITELDEFEKTALALYDEACAAPS